MAPPTDTNATKKQFSTQSMLRSYKQNKLVEKVSQSRESAGRQAGSRLVSQ